ncbi:unnamed protein product [Calicophoron daubneyi]|uniref:Trichoplein keratin filament-binding protein n=1 Tax=Calicophoron daubneyi TaxID=300641 RepID=A0AAV2TGX1_CALDB
MSFLNLRCTPASRKDALEAILVRRRTREAENYSQWQNTSHYFNEAVVRAEREKRWTSAKNYDSSMQAYDAQALDNNDREKALEVRREKLRNLLENEANEQKLVLEAINEQKKDKAAMLMRSTALKESRDRERAEMANKLLEDHFRANNADLRDMTRASGQKAVAESWDSQVDGKHKRAEEQRKQEIADHEMHAEIDKLESQVSEEASAKRLKARKEQLDGWRQQLEELHRREEAAKRLEFNEEALSRELVALDKLERERCQIEEQCKRELYGRALLHQHQAALRRRAATIQAEMEADLEWLTQVENQKTEEEKAIAARKCRERDNLAAMRELIEANLEKERKQGIEIDALESYEASRIWSKKEEEWRKEAEARQKLLQDVLEERRLQVSEQLDKNRRLQREELESREALLESLEKVSREDADENAQKTAAAKQQVQELGEQVNEKLEAKRRLQADDIAEQAAIREAEVAYEEMLRREAEKLHLSEQAIKSRVPTREQLLSTFRHKPGGNIW